MKNITLKVISFISLFLLFTSLISSKPLCFTSKKNESIITIDSTSSVGLPMRLRDIPTLNISGSAQFTKDQLLNLKNYINKDNINESVEIKTPSNIEETLSSIFKSTGYPYNIKVYIKTNNKEYYTYLVSRTNKTITTLDNDLIKINEIVELKKYPN